MNEKEFPTVSFEKAYLQKGSIGLFQILFPAKGFTTFSVFDFKERVKPMLCMIKEGIGEWAFEESIFHSMAEKYAAKLQDKTTFKKRYYDWLKVCEKIEDFARMANETKLEKMTEREIKPLLERLSETITEFWNYSIFIDMFDAGYDVEDIERINKDYGFGKNEIQVLTTPTKQSYVQQNRLLLYDLLDAPSQGKKEEFLRKFFWIKTDYSDAGKYGKEELEKELSEAKKTGWERENSKLKDSFARLERKQKEILSAKGLLENPFWFYNELTYWRDERKKHNYISLFAATQLALSVLKRKGMEKYLNTITHEELFNLPKRQELDKRKKLFIFIISDEKIAVYSGNDAEKMFIDAVGVQEAKGDLRGMSASIGIARGKAKIILSPKEFGKMEQGDILITHMTRPEFVPIMKKAAAIVTDEGGITCHAAIISRELGIPCVVGTKIATKTFKDNDMVEVKASHGLVRKL